MRQVRDSMRSLEKRQKGQKKVLSLLLALRKENPDARGRGEPSSSHPLLPENQILNVTRRETGNSVLDRGISRQAQRCSKHPDASDTGYIMLAPCFLQPFRSAWQHVALPSHAWTVTRTATIKARPARPMSHYDLPEPGMDTYGISEENLQQLL